MRSQYCGFVSRVNLGQTITLYGWVHRRRDHGGVIFIDMRDREGLVQIVCDPDTPATFATADKLRNEYVLKIVGRVRERPNGTVNPNLVSGEVEVLASDIEILNASLSPPFQIDIETPMLTRSTPEGARDYLVPSRVHAGEFYALPQSPQLFKQLLMIAGFD